ncbi:MAG: putative dual-specificity RNA methyltransferase RlmN [Phycisphaerae bacterium]|nr:putative dual-specificity RNA methyltransferase RlmN [Phycisphaerae bacterium]
MHDDHTILGWSADQWPTLLAQLLGTAPPAFRVKQLQQWIYQHKIADFAEMTNLPADWRIRLAQQANLTQATVVADQSASDQTRKLLLQWLDGATSECVLIPDGERRTACISSQVGCPVKCAFCASGVDGLQRNLTAAQIVEQAWRLATISQQQGGRLSNIVFMGLGEPLANYTAVLAALRIINAEWGLGIGARHITISTVGLPSQMRRLAEEDLQVTLALSLHAPDDELRKQLIPWAERVTIAELIDAGCYYFERTGREITLEYILLEGVNNHVEQARQLARITRQMRSNVNLIAYNPVVDLGFGRPSADSVQGFCNWLRDAGVNAHVRTSRGLDIDAACGQLRRRHSTSPAATIALPLKNR